MTTDETQFILTHKTLLEDQRVTSAVALRDLSGKTIFIALAQGSTLLIMDPSTYEIKEKYPFMNPILEIAALYSDQPSIFVVLRNFNWFIFNLPELFYAGHFDILDISLAKRFITPTKSSLSHGSNCNDPISTASIRFLEKKIPIAIHPNYIALHIVNNLIHVISTKEPQKPPILIKINQPNVVDIAFIGPISPSFNARLAVISDPEYNRQEHQQQLIQQQQQQQLQMQMQTQITPIQNEMKANKRVFIVYNLPRNGTEFRKEFSIDLRPDAHTILPLAIDMGSSCVIFTFDGLIRITCPETVQPTTEHITVFLEGITLVCEHIFDDYYYLADAGGGLCAGKFPVQDRPTTEKLREVGPVSSIVTIDPTHVLITSTFGDASIYKLNVSSRDDEGASLKLIHTIEAPGYISNISYNQITKDIKLMTGRGTTAQIRNFHLSLGCEKLSELKVNGCLNIFSAPFKEHSDKIILCLSFLDNSFLLVTDGSKFTYLTLEHFIMDQTTLYFGKSETGFIQVTPHMCHLFTAETVLATHPYQDEEIIYANRHGSYICHISDNGVVRVLSTSTLEAFKKLQIKDQSNNPHFAALSDEYLCFYTIDNKFSVQFLTHEDRSSLQIKENFIEDDTISSLAIAQAGTSHYVIYIGTISGNLYSYSDNQQITKEHVSEDPIYLKNTDNGLFVAASPPFKIVNNERQSIDCNDCFDICSNGNFICVLRENLLEVYKTGEGKHGISKLEKECKNTINALFIGQYTCRLEEDLSTKGQKLGIYDEQQNLITATTPETKYRVSLFDKINLFDNELITSVSTEILQTLEETKAGNEF